LALPDIVAAQGGFVLGCVPRWNVFTPWGLAGFAMFLVAAAAESNRCPFDLPEGESELIAGFLTEYSGFKYALFFLGEYLGLFAISGLAVTLFLGGWQAPAPWLEWFPSWGWFALKFGALIFLFIWTRATLPRLRLDQLLSFAWKFLIPLALVNLVVAVAWWQSSAWQFAGAPELRWLLGALALAVPYFLLGRAFQSGRPAMPRYTYAE
jgi:NADH-quinone oxidoreductase subunit H